MARRYKTQEPTNFTGVIRELRRIEATLNQIVDGQHEVLSRAPDRPIVGLVVFADGTSWNPGSGMGLYEYNGTSTASAAWSKL
ncbi:MAG: hypothetical protein GWN58_64780 [Anaerolineae bacterium]|nr:hypothetical protein [Anaerolineae bacterium]